MVETRYEMLQEEYDRDEEDATLREQITATMKPKIPFFDHDGSTKGHLEAEFRRERVLHWVVEEEMHRMRQQGSTTYMTKGP